MSAERKAIQSFRHRGFQPAGQDSEIIQMFGDEPAPLNPDGSPMKKLWDNDVEQHIVTRKHVEPATLETPFGDVPNPEAPKAE